MFLQLDFHVLERTRQLTHLISRYNTQFLIEITHRDLVRGFIELL